MTFSQHSFAATRRLSVYSRAVLMRVRLKPDTTSVMGGWVKSFAIAALVVLRSQRVLRLTSWEVVRPEMWSVWREAFRC